MRWFILVMLWAMLGAEGRADQVVTLKAENMTVTVPEHWQAEKSGDTRILFNAVDKPDRAVLMIMTMPNPGNYSIEDKKTDTQMRDSFVEGMTKNGWSAAFDDESTTMSDGFPFYRFHATLCEPGRPNRYVRGYFTTAKGKYYGLMMMYQSQNLDGEVRGIGESWHFTVPAEAPAKTD